MPGRDNANGQQGWVHLEEEMCRDLVMQLPLGVMVWRLEDPDDATSLTLAGSNRMAAKISGIELANHVGENIGDFLPSAIGTGLVESYAEVVRSGIRLDLGDVQDETLLNQRHVYRIQAIPLPGDCVAVVFDDVTEKTRAENELRKSERHLRWLSNSTSDIITVARLDGEIVSVNEAVRRTLGYDPQTLVGESLTKRFMHPDDVEDVLATVAARLAGSGENSDVRCRILHSDGTWRYFDSRAIMSENQQGEMLAVITGHDVTQRKLAEDALLESEERFRRLAENAPDVIFRYRLLPEPGFQYVSPAVEAITGYKPEDFHRNPMRDLEIVHPDDRAKLEEAIETGEAVRLAARWIHKDGSPIWFELQATPVHDDAGTLIAYEGIARDITERKAAEHDLEASNERLVAILNSSPVPLAITRASDGLVLYGNGPLGEAMTMPLDELVGRKSPEFYVDLEDRAHIMRHLRRDGSVTGQELQIRRTDGTTFWASLSARLASFGDEDVMVVGFADITQLKQAKEELLASRERLRLLLDASPVAIGISRESDGRILYANPSMGELLGVDPENRDAHDATEFYELAERDRLIQMLRRHGEGRGIEIQLQRVDGSQIWTSASFQKVLFDGEQCVIVGLADITDRVMAEQNVQHLAYHDALTGLPNRELLKDRLKIALAQARRSGNQVAVVYMDIDRFKDINDSLGHTAGDKLLQRIGRQLQLLVRDGDTVARVGGDEFIILLPEITDAEQASVVAERILERIRKRRSLQGRRIQVTTSLGISLFPGDGEDVEGLLTRADTAMYKAKDRGRNQVQYYTREMTSDIERRLGMAYKLRRALEHGDLVPYFQPQIDVGTGRIIGAEALIRWHHAERGIVYPDEFISIVEDSDLSWPLTQHVLRVSSSLYSELDRKGLAPGRIAINLGPAELHERQLPDVFERTLRDSGMEPHHLQVEITEQEAMLDPDLALETLTALKSMGVQIIVDDFGTGHSSLSYLQRFPVDGVKVDRSFVHHIEDDPESAAIVSAIISMAHSLDLGVVAEGVETKSQLKFLRKRGCEEYQGFLFSPAVPASNFEKLLARQALTW